ncbi:hypothetical protein Tco_0085102 [Tanacetum coccineum]
MVSVSGGFGAGMFKCGVSYNFEALICRGFAAFVFALGVIKRPLGNEVLETDLGTTKSCLAVMERNVVTLLLDAVKERRS